MKNITPNQMYSRIGQNVAKIRKEQNMSQLELSLNMGYKSVSVVSASEIFYKNKHFNLKQLLNISQILDVTICELINLE